jgi:hypothetical protein
MIPLCGVIRFAFPLTNDVIGPLNHVRSAPAIYYVQPRGANHKPQGMAKATQSNGRMVPLMARAHAPAWIGKLGDGDTSTEYLGSLAPGSRWPLDSSQVSLTSFNKLVDVEAVGGQICRRYLM